MSFERDLLTMTKMSTFKCILPLDKRSHYCVVFVMTKNKQKLYFSDYYKTITHVQKHKVLNVSFKLFMHILAQ